MTAEMNSHLHRPDLQLSALAISSLVIYALAFVWSYSLHKWWRYPHLTIGKITHHEPQAGAAYMLAVSALFLLYGLACRLAKGHHRSLTWGVVIAGAVAFNGVMMGLYPVAAADVFDNIVRGRMLAYHGANPFYQTPIEFKHDPLYGYAAWVSHPSAYGPLWELIAAGASALAGDGVVANVLMFKFVSVTAYAGTAVLIGLMLRRSAPERALYGVMLFAWNPLVIYATAGNGHNDAVMVFFIVLGFYGLMRGWLTVAALAQVAGALVKFIPALLVPVMMIAALRRLEDRWARMRYVLITIGVCALLTIGLYAPFWRGGDVMGINRRAGLFTTSLPALLKVTLEPRLGEPVANGLAVWAALIVLVAWITRQLRITWRSDDVQAPVRVGLSILLFYLLVSCLWFQPWYAVWPLALAALLPDGTLQRGSVVLSFVVTWKMPLIDFVLAREELPPKAWREWRLTPAVLGVPWIYFAYRRIRGWG